MTGRGSHAWCERCHARWVDKRAAYRMCPPCKRLHIEELRVSRTKIKARRAARIAAKGVAPVTETPDNTVPEARKPRTRLTDEQKAEVINLYMHTDTPVYEISRAYNIGKTETYRIMEASGITWRRGDAPQNGQVTDTVPPETQKALENMLMPPQAGRGPQAHKLPTAPEPPVVHRIPVENLPPAAAEKLPAFVAIVEGTVGIRAADMLNALQKLRSQYPDLKVTQIREE